MRSILLSLVLVTFAAASSHAQGGVRGMLRLAGEFGGDPVIQFTYSDGSTPEVQAGGGLVGAVGAAIPIFDAAGQGVDLQASIGAKYRTIPPATNQSANWLRFPVEGLVFYRAPVGIRVGGGMAVHFANVLKTDGDVASGRLEFKSRPGVVLQGEYGRKRFAIDVRYTLMKYEIASGGVGTVNANSFGIGLSYIFGGRKAAQAATR